MCSHWYANYLVMVQPDVFEIHMTGACVDTLRLSVYTCIFIGKPDPSLHQILSVVCRSTIVFAGSLIRWE